MHLILGLWIAQQRLKHIVAFPQLPQKLNEFDSEGNIPLNLALLGRNEGIANTLVSHSCDLDLIDPSGNSLLHLAIMRGDTFSASFLIKNGANTILARKENQETPLHLVASYKPSQVPHSHSMYHMYMYSVHVLEAYRCCVVCGTGTCTCRVCSTEFIIYTLILPYFALCTCTINVHDVILCYLHSIF